MNFKLYIVVGQSLSHGIRIANAIAETAQVAVSDNYDTTKDNILNGNSTIIALAIDQESRQDLLDLGAEFEYEIIDLDLSGH